MMFDLIHGDVLEWLTSYDGPKYQAILSDPPYALISIVKRFGKKDSAPAQEGRDGRFLRLSGGFMGQKWDGFDSLEHYQDWVKTWAKLLIEKALLPGAACLFFGGTRTYHHLTTGLERGGFEIIDCLMWLYGAGFPKSHDISKGLDKAAGVKRKVLGTRSTHRDRPKTENWDKADALEIHDESLFDPKSSGMLAEVTEPATPDAEMWDGYGTGLKPAWEPIVLCRAPRGKMTFAELAKTYGTGALNIDGSRIAGDMGTDRAERKPRRTDNIVFGEANENINPQSSLGRWPANLLLFHHEDCVKIGEFEVEGRTINRWKSGMKPFGGVEREMPPWFYLANDEMHRKARKEFEDAGGSFGDFNAEQFESEKLPPEMVERWACVAECPVRALDDQAGDRKTGDLNRVNTSIGGRATYQGGGAGTRDHKGSAGGASRFFYSGKASRKEKDKGCEHFYWARKEGAFVGISQKEWLKLPRKKRAKANIHPTVKPLDLMRYLSTMILPPDREQERRLLVPFAGSGSEMIGAIQAGWEIVTGIEMETNYVNIAQARYTGNLGLFSLK